MEEINLIKKKLSHLALFRRLFSLITVISLTIGFIMLLVGLGRGKNWLLGGIISLMITLVSTISLWIVTHIYGKENKNLNNLDSNLIDVYDEEIVDRMHYESVNLEYLKSSEEISKDKIDLLRLVFIISSILFFLLFVFCFLAIFVPSFKIAGGETFSIFESLISTNNSTYRAIVISSFSDAFSVSGDTKIILSIELLTCFILTFGLVFLFISCICLSYSFNKRIYNFAIKVRSQTFEGDLIYLKAVIISLAVIWVIIICTYLVITICNFNNPNTNIDPSVGFIFSLGLSSFLFLMIPLCGVFIYKILKGINQ